MPQLNPSPWFAILVFTWLTFLTFIPPKIMAHTYPYEPTLQDTQSPKTQPWNWLWQ
uniref:ATP synthase complex subunit 8 n=1 Tax=Pseudomugil reticulatus TaxID=1498519 RepID=A0A1B2M4Y4_9TELE|nr:ATPase subunit 8 [Pseudomugil reticulatus]